MIGIDNHKFYKGAFDKFGLSAKGVHWSSRQTQYKRFEILTNFIKDDIKESLVVDVGCGFCEYYIYLLKEDLVPLKYVGVDCESWMINIARKRIPRYIYKTDFCIRNAVKKEIPRGDYIVSSGAMNILNKEDFYSFISNCYEHANKGFIFNFLKNNSLNIANVQEVIRFCRSFDCEISTRNGYVENDFTIFLKKNSV